MSLSRASDSGHGWLSHVADEVTFSQVHRQYGARGVYECCRQFRALYCGSNTYTDDELLDRFEELQAQTDDENDNHNNHNNNDDDDGDDDCRIVHYAAGRTPPYDTRKDGNDCEPREEEEKQWPAQRHTTTTAAVRSAIQPLAAAYAPESKYDDHRSSQSSDTAPVYSAARQASPSPLRHCAPPSMSSATSPSSDSCHETPGRVDGDGELDADGRALLDGDRVLYSLTLRRSHEDDVLSRLQQENQVRIANQQHQQAMEAASARRIQAKRRRRRCRRCCRRCSAQLLALALFIVKALQLAGVGYVAWRLVDRPAGDTAMDVVYELADDVLTAVQLAVEALLRLAAGQVM